MNSMRILEAVRFAEECHRGQTRHDGKPYMPHPIEVAMMASIEMELLKEEFNIETKENVVIAALLHDVIEMCDVSFEALRELYGIGVARIVLNLSRNPGEEEYEQYIDRLLDAGEETLIIKEADLKHNCSRTGKSSMVSRYLSSLKKIRKKRME